MSSSIQAMQQGRVALSEWIRTSCQGGFRQQFKSEAAHLGEVNLGCLPVIAPWQSVILLANSQMRITFKAFFYLGEVRHRLGQLKREKTETITERLGHDLMKEFCNLTGGSLKRNLAKVNVSVGLSLPLVTRGFDEVFVIPRKNTEFFKEMFKIEDDEGLSVGCVMEVEALDLQSFVNIPWHHEVQDESGEMEFL